LSHRCSSTGYDEPAILSYAISSFCPTSADGLQYHIRVGPVLRIEERIAPDRDRRIGSPSCVPMSSSRASARTVSESMRMPVSSLGASSGSHGVRGRHQHSFCGRARRRRILSAAPLRPRRRGALRGSPACRFIRHHSRRAAHRSRQRSICQSIAGLRSLLNRSCTAAQTRSQNSG
jgi:hypothetical protein